MVYCILYNGSGLVMSDLHTITQHLSCVIQLVQRTWTQGIYVLSMAAIDITSIYLNVLACCYHCKRCSEITVITLLQMVCSVKVQTASIPVFSQMLNVFCSKLSITIHTCVSAVCLLLLHMHDLFQVHSTPSYSLCNMHQLIKHSSQYAPFITGLQCTLFNYK